MGDDALTRKTETAAYFNSWAADFDRQEYFAHFGRLLEEVVVIEPGQRVLDVATGRGAVLFPVIERVGTTGEGVGIDLAEGMVQAANEEAERRGWGSRVQAMDAERLHFPDAAFDRVLCGFGVMFFPAVSHALSEFRRVLKPGGRLGISTWQAPITLMVATLLRELGMWKGTAGLVRFGDVDALTSLLELAGFQDVQVVAESTPVAIGTVDQYWEIARIAGHTQASIDALSAA